MSTLLVVDDSPTVRKLVEISFTSRPWELQFASSGARGIEVALSWNPDVVLLDYLLPDMNGADVCREVTRAGLDCRVVLMTAKEGLRDEFSAFPCVVGHIAKPFTVNLIVDATARALATRKLAAGAGGLGRTDAAVRPLALDPPRSHAPTSSKVVLGSAAPPSSIMGLGALGAPAASVGAARRLDTLFGLLDGLDVIARRRATGILTVTGTRGRWRFIAVDGEIRAVSNENALVDLDAIGARPGQAIDARAHAALAPPAYLSFGGLSASGFLEQQKRLASVAVVDALHHPSNELAWQNDLPTSVRSWLPATPLPLHLLQLIGLRAAPELAAADPPDVFVRRRAANTAVAAQDLTSTERAVLTLAAKPRRAAEVAAQLGQDPSATNQILRRLFAVDLLVRADAPSPRASTAVVVEERRASRDALVAFLHRVPYVTAVVGLSPDECTVEQVSHHGPRIVVVGVEGLSDPGAWIARLRVACPDVLVVGIARPSTSGAHTECTDCDGTLVEPVIDDELIDFIREA